MRSVLEFGVPVWHSKITNEEQSEIERVQKSFLHIVFGNDYGSYLHARNELGLETLKKTEELSYVKSLQWKLKRIPSTKTGLNQVQPVWSKPETLNRIIKLQEQDLQGLKIALYLTLQASSITNDTALE